MASIAFRWGGLLLVIGAVLLGAGIMMLSLGVDGVQALSSPLVSIPFFLSSILMLLSLPAMYAKQAEAAGWLGLVGHALLEIGVLLFFSLTSLPLRFPSLNPPADGENVVDFILGISFTAGLLLTSIATQRARVFPRSAGIVLGAGTALFFFGDFVSWDLPRVAGQVDTMLLAISLAVGFAWIGVAMVREREMPRAAGSPQALPRLAGER